MPSSPHPNRLDALFAPSLRELAELGRYASDQAFDDWNTYHRLIVLDGQPRERQTDLWSWRTWLRDRLWVVLSVVPSFFVREFA